MKTLPLTNLDEIARLRQDIRDLLAFIAVDPEGYFVPGWQEIIAERVETLRTMGHEVSFFEVA